MKKVITLLALVLFSFSTFAQTDVPEEIKEQLNKEALYFVENFSEGELTDFFEYIHDLIEEDNPRKYYRMSGEDIDEAVIKRLNVLSESMIELHKTLGKMIQKQDSVGYQVLFNLIADNAEVDWWIFQLDREDYPEEYKELESRSTEDEIKMYKVAERIQHVLAGIVQEDEDYAYTILLSMECDWTLVMKEYKKQIKKLK